MIYGIKNGVINGVRAESLVPNESCHNLCVGKERCYTTPNLCKFLQAYSNQLRNLDFVETTNRIANAIRQIVKRNPMYNGEEPECILMVFETPNNKCSERVPLQQWFLSHGVILEEFER